MSSRLLPPPPDWLALRPSWNAASLQRGSSARAEANRSSVNLLSKHSVLWWKPCCLTPCLYRITAVSIITAEQQLSDGFFLPFVYLTNSSILSSWHLSLLALIKLSPVHSLNMLWLLAKEEQRPLCGIKAYWHLQRIPAIHRFHLLQITKGGFVVREQASV